MFQYAFARSISMHRQDIVLDISWFKKFNNHAGFMLNLFPIKLKVINSLGFHRTIPGRALKKFKLLPPNYVFENDLSFNNYANFLKNKSVYFSGYFQSELFFNNIRDILLCDFSFPALQGQASYNCRNFIQSHPEVCSLHIRRGDYLSKNNNTVFKILNLEYYEQAYLTLKNKIEKDLPIVVFSDDPEWAKANLTLPTTLYFHEGNSGKMAIDDMHLMSICTHNIIANSTFSWWAAWLNKNSQKIIVAPKNWFKLSNLNNNNIIPNSWNTIDV